jgi:hypothetical protein
MYDFEEIMGWATCWIISSTNSSGHSVEDKIIKLKKF